MSDEATKEAERLNRGQGWMFDNDFTAVKYACHNSPEPILEEATGTYTDPDAPISYTAYTWNHS